MSLLSKGISSKKTILTVHLRSIPVLEQILVARCITEASVSAMGSWLPKLAKT